MTSSSKQVQRQAKTDSGYSFTRTQWISLAVLALGATTVLMWRLDAASLADWDEAIYAQISKEIVTSGDWITLHWGYEPWFHKPPLFMWTTAACFKLFGVSEFWARFPSALSGLGVVGCTYLIARKLYGHTAGLFSATILLTNYAFVHFSRFGTTDIALTLFSYLAIYALLGVYQGQQRAWYGVWGAIAGALMTKGIAGLAVVIAITMTLTFTGRLLNGLSSPAFWLGLVLASVLVIPWHWAVFAIHGQVFVDEYWLYHVVARSTGEIEGHEGGIFYYVGTLSQHFFPWVYLLPLALFQQVRKPRQCCTSPASILLVFVAVVFGGFSLASTKLSWYIVPVYPAMAIWIGYFLYRLFVYKDRLLLWGLLVSGATVIILFPPRIVFLSPVLQQVLTIAGLLSLIAITLAIVKLQWNRKILIVAVFSLFSIAGLREIKGLYHGYKRPMAVLAHSAEVLKRPEESPLLVAKLSQRLYMPAAMFYSNRPIAWVRSPEDLADYFAGDIEPDSKQDILLATDDITALAVDYSIEPNRQEGPLTYATIQKRDL